jgi:hypothetical protein
MLGPDRRDQIGPLRLRRGNRPVDGLAHQEPLGGRRGYLLERQPGHLEVAVDLVR